MTVIPSIPITILNGTVADATQVMANFLAIQAAVNTNAAANGVNSDITQLTGLTTPLSVLQGGTGQMSLAANGVLIGEGTTGFNSITPGAAGTVLTSQGIGEDPIYSTALPTGAIIIWSTDVAPSNFLECNGSAVSRTTYVNLFTVIGVTFGDGDGVTTFNLPDTRGYFVRGWDDGAGVDPSRTFGSVQQDQFQTHGHGTTQSPHNHSINSNNILGSGGTGPLIGGSGSTENTNNATISISVNAPNSGNTGSETRPKNIAFMYCIRI
jgi:microcystin-dependent protein